MNHLLPPWQPRNRFFAMRHGESEANRLGLIVSGPESGVPGYGLSDTGREQVRLSIVNDRQLDADTLIYSSDFKRAVETARIVHAQLGCHRPVETHEALRERFFGEFDGGDHGYYQQVWEADAREAGHTEHGVEAVTAVMARVTALVRELDRAWQGRRILLVAHGDVLQILQTAFQRQTPERHRALAHLDTADIRELVVYQHPV